MEDYNDVLEAILSHCKSDNRMHLCNDLNELRTSCGHEAITTVSVSRKTVSLEPYRQTLGNFAGVVLTHDCWRCLDTRLKQLIGLLL